MRLPWPTEGCAAARAPPLLLLGRTAPCARVGVGARRVGVPLRCAGAGLGGRWDVAAAPRYATAAAAALALGPARGTLAAASSACCSAPGREGALGMAAAGVPPLLLPCAAADGDDGRLKPGDIGRDALLLPTPPALPLRGGSAPEMRSGLSPAIIRRPGVTGRSRCRCRCCWCWC